MFVIFRFIIIGLLFLFSGVLYAERCYSFIDISQSKIELKSNWRFAKGDNPNWKKLNYEDGDWLVKSLPDAKINKRVKVAGFYWYRCFIYLPDKIRFPKHPVSLSLGEYEGSTEIYLNNQLITKPINPRQKQAEQTNHEFSIPFHFFHQGANLLAIRVYFYNNISGFRVIPSFQDESKTSFQNISPKAMLILSSILILTIGVYFITDCFIRPFSLDIMFFVGFCILFSTYELLSGEVLTIESPMTSYKYSLLVYILLPVLFVNFLVNYLGYKRKLYTYIYEIIMLLFFIGVYFLNNPSYYPKVIQLNTVLFLLTFLVLVLLVVYYAKKKLPHTKFILIGFITLVPFFLLDIFLYFKGIKQNSSTLLFGSVFFLFFTSVQLHTKALNKSLQSSTQKKETLQQDIWKEGFILGLESQLKKPIHNIESLIENSINKQPIESKTLKQMQTDVYSIESIIVSGQTLWEIEHGTFNIDIEKFSLVEIVNDVIGDVENNLQQKRKSKEILIEPLDLEIENSQLLFYLMIYHLVENSYLYSNKQARIQINITKEGEEIRILVSDEGYGIPKTNQELIFQKFVSIVPQGSQLQIQRTGIGLTLVSEIVKILGGKIDLFSQADFGTKITIYIPTKANL